MAINEKMQVAKFTQAIIKLSSERREAPRRRRVSASSEAYSNRRTIYFKSGYVGEHANFGTSRRRTMFKFSGIDVLGVCF